MEDDQTLPSQEGPESSTMLQEDLHLSFSDDESIALSEVGEEETPSTPPDMEDVEPGCTLAETILEVLSDLSIIQDANMEWNNHSQVQECFQETHKILHILIKEHLK